MQNCGQETNTQALEMNSKLRNQSYDFKEKMLSSIGPIMVYVPFMRAALQE